MLVELSVRNFALLEEVRLVLRPGLNVLSGETGAGKSIIIDAIGTVLGGRASTEVIRAGADRAAIEARFHLLAANVDAVREVLAEVGLEPGSDGSALTLTREIGRTARSVARINGRAVPVTMLAQVGATLVDIHGQHEHLSLLRPGAQRDLLDHFGDLGAQRLDVAALVRELRQIKADLRAMVQDEREIVRRVDLLSYQLEEIQAARLRPGEDEQLEQERTRLANAERLAELASAIHESLDGGTGETPGAIDQLGLASRMLSQLLRIDGQLADQEQMLTEAFAQAEELAQTVRAYQESIEFAPERLAEVEQRLELINTLQRKYGATIDEVLRFAESAGIELEEMVNREQRTAALEKRAASLEERIGQTAAGLSTGRRTAAESLARHVAQEMGALSLRGSFFVSVEQEPSLDGVPANGERLRFDETGIDTIDFRFAPNPGEPARSVARTASGGELSRILLALKAVLSAADRTPTLIFDEVDAGIGGRNGQVVGQKLAQIGERHQVLCVTHLPHIAAFGDAHFFISKREQGGRTATAVSELDAAERDRELAQMLGGVSAATMAQAREMTQAAEAWKAGRVGLASAPTAAAADLDGKRSRPRPRRGVSGEALLQGVT
ncbi:MAG: DNA repair protein RecN [Chloroflexota bacterium]